MPDHFVRALRRAHEGGACILSICSGAFVLAAAGLLDGRRATTHWKYADRLADRYPDVEVDPDVLFVDDSTGFNDPQLLRLHFRRVVGTPPSTYRRNFGYAFAEGDD